MPATWSEALAAQAASDLAAYEFLSSSSLPSSHRLHYLQMWLEKLCKAYLWKPHSVELELRVRHNVIAKVLPRLIAEHWRRIGFANSPDLSDIRSLCREIDLLHPQVDDGERRLDNVEYPWRGKSGSPEIPAQWGFPIASRLYTPSGRLLLKAADRLTRDRSMLLG